ncbi:hypothetical protein [Virgibacillus sediminis]|uniref:HNH endonuclease n=1 Tax=Virgibacillus sediminis TaxID=202260 RepID=A0ABV7A560_9BACI
MAANVLKEVCNLLDLDNENKAEEVIKRQYPFQNIEYLNRSYTKSKMLEIFLRDGFIDRYSGYRLIFPPVLRLLSTKFPDSFPFHKNWKMSECHIAYWELMPTIDHVFPIAQGGTDEGTNLICTSMIRNSAKSNFTLEQLGWEIHSRGDLDEWDGLVHWFLNYVEKYEEFLQIEYIKQWYSLAKKKMG